jgi:hypothetical protein
MAQLKEDEWPGDSEPTTSERQDGASAQPVRPQASEREAPAARSTVPVNNTRPDEAVD